MQLKRHGVSGLVPICVMAVAIALSCLAARGGLFSFIPKPMKQVPEELRGDYVLLLKRNPDKTQEQFTNAPPFATILSNRVVLAQGQVRLVDSLLRVREKGTNVYLMSFEDQSTWLITPTTSPPGLVVLAPVKGRDAKQTTIFVISPKPAAASRTNAPAGAKRER